LNIAFIETSAKNSTNVEKAFLLMAGQIKSRFKPSPIGGGGGTDKNVNLQGGKSVNNNGKSGGCC
jgi:Ras-related protein Rab-1A